MNPPTTPTSKTNAASVVLPPLWLLKAIAKVIQTYAEYAFFLAP
jgi:hypothetical protein